MNELHKYVIQSDGKQREVEFEELNQLSKDILWTYDENIWSMDNPFAPSDSLKMKYWEYLTLNGDKWFYEEDKQFYRIGSLIILLCFCFEYSDIESGDQKVFRREELPTVLKYVQNFEPKDKRETMLKNKVIVGLQIANSLTEDQLIDTEFVHELNDNFYENFKEIGTDFIVSYYEMKLKKRH